MSKNFRVLLVMVIVAGLAAGAAFGAGTVFGRTLGPKQAATIITSGQGAAGGAGAAGTNGGAAIAGRGGTIGTVDSLNGDTLTIRGQDGTPTTVKLDSKTTIHKTVDGTTADLTPGTNVFVTGNKAADGTVTASQISITPAGASPSPGAGSGTSRPTPGGASGNPSGGGRQGGSSGGQGGTGRSTGN